MDVEITPEPTQEERKAIVRALREEGQAGSAPTSWRSAGLGPGPDDEADQAVASPRQSRGATRA
jgi:hypothetical protein